MAPPKTIDATLQLIAAARWGSETQVQAALKNEGVKKNYKETAGYGYTPLHSAVHSNKRVAWVLIVDPEVSVNAKTDLGHTPLHFGWPQCVDSMLLSGKRVKWDEPDDIGQTPLLYHARMVNYVILRDLLKLGVECVSMKSITTDGFTVLHQVVERDSPFPTWYDTEYHSPTLRCKVVGLLLDELKRRASESKKRPADLTTTEATKEPAKDQQNENQRQRELDHRSPEKSEPSTLQSDLPQPDTAEPASARRGCIQLPDCLNWRAKEDTNTKESAENQQNGCQRQPGEDKGSRDQKTDPEIKKTDPEIKMTHTGEKELQSVVVDFVNIQDKIGRTALHYIAEDGCVEILDKLLNWFTVEEVRSKVHVNVRDFYGFAPLHLAVLKGHTQMVERLLNKRETDACVTLGAPRPPKTELMEWNEEHLEMCRPNLSSKAPKKEHSIEGLTALHFAAMGGHTKIADLLLNWKQVTKQRDESKTTTVVVTAKDEENLKSPFTFSIDNGHLEVATLLLRRIEAEDHGGVAFKKLLTLARDKQTTDNPASEVLANNIQVAGITNTFERLLIVAANVNLPDVIRNVFNWIPEVNVNVEATLEDERNSSNLRATPLHFAVLLRHVDIVRQLLSHKSLDVNAEDSYGRTPLQIAVEGDLSRHAGDGRKLSDEDKMKRKQIEKLLMERAEVKDLVERLYRDREVFINAVNALLVGAALIATVTFAGWLTPPLGLTSYVAPEPSPATSPHYTSLPHPTSVKVFWVSNSLSFFLAIATVLVCAYAAMPSLQHTYIREAVKFLRTTLIVASMLFLFSVFFVLGAFASAGFAVLPSPHRAYKLSMILTVAIGGLFCSCCLGVLMWKLSRQSYEYSCGYLSSLCQTSSSVQNRPSGVSHGEETSSNDLPQQESKPSMDAPPPQQGRPTETSKGPDDDSKVEPSPNEPPIAKSGVGLSEDNSSQGGVEQVVEKDNEQPEKVGLSEGNSSQRGMEQVVEKDNEQPEKVGLSEDNSSQGGVEQVVDKDNEQLEKDDETVNKTSMVSSKWKDIARKRKGEDWSSDVKIEFGQEKIMIDLNDIKCVLKGSDVTDNIVNIFIHRILNGVPRDTWIASTQLTNALFSVDVDKWSDRIEEFMNWPNWKMAKEKSYHIFPFGYNAVHEQLNHGQPVSQVTVGQGVGFSGHWSLICREPNQFVHLNSWELSHKEDNVPLFFKRLEVNLMEVSNDNDKATIYGLPWEKPPVPQQQGRTECGYYMMLNLIQYLKARREGHDTILDGSNWFTQKDVEELRGAIYKIIEDAVMAEWKKEFPDRD